MLHTVSNTRKSVTFNFQTPRSGSKNQGTAQLRSVWKEDETLLGVFDIASQNIKAKVHQSL